LPGRCGWWVHVMAQEGLSALPGHSLGSLGRCFAGATLSSCEANTMPEHSVSASTTAHTTDRIVPDA